MKFIRNVKFNYYSKQIEDLLKDSKFNELEDFLYKLSSNDKNLFLNIHKHFQKSFFELQTVEDVFPNNLIFINSFLKSERSFISNFIKYYFKQINFNNYFFYDYISLLSNFSKKYLNKEMLEFSDIIENSLNLQSILSFENKDSLVFVENDYPFFSTDGNLNFANSNYTNCFFHILDHPYNVYSSLKSVSNSKDEAFNKMYNLDSRSEFISNDGVNIELVKKDWMTHSKSWLDPNVKSSLKGLTIKIEEIVDSPTELFSSVIMHLNQSGNKLPLKYDIIEKYIEENKYKKENYTNQDLSNNEKKFIQKNSIKIFEELDFSI